MKVLRFLLPALLALLLGVPLWAATVELLLPLGRTAYQTNEQIDLSVVRSDTQALPAAPLSVVLTGVDGSRLSFTFPTGPVALVGNDARATEHLHLNGWLLRPGKYTVQVSVNGAAAQKEIELFSYLRKSSYILLNWGSGAHGAQHIEEGEDGMGFNLIYGDYRPVADARGNAETTLRGGADYMNNCTMSGAHQMDLRMECDWSDPYVTRGGTARVVAQAFAGRVTPNCLGVHFYDEPGLTWWNDPKTGEFTPHNIPAQDRAFKSAFGSDPLQYNDVKPDDPEAVAKWNAWSRWKESFMEAAWKEARAGVDKVNPNYLSATQSQYAWNAYTDGYYFNVVRSLPVISGHGGYDDGAGGYLYPDFTLAFGRMRDLREAGLVSAHLVQHDQQQIPPGAEYVVHGRASRGWPRRRGSISSNRKANSKRKAWSSATRLMPDWAPSSPPCRSTTARWPCSIRSTSASTRRSNPA